MENRKPARRLPGIRALIADHRPLSIRSSLALLVIACVVPGSLMSAFLIFDNYVSQRDQLIHDTVEIAGALATTLDRDLASLESGLHVLAASPMLATDDLGGFYDHAKQVLPSQNADSYVLLDASGRQLLNTLRPYVEPPSVTAGSHRKQQVFETGATVVTDIFTGSVTGRPVLAMAVPVHRDGKIVYGLNVGIAPDRVAGLLQRQRLPQGWIAVVLDRSGAVIARTQEMSRFIGKKLRPDVIAAVRNMPEGFIEMVTLEGMPVVTAFSRSEMSSWTVLVSIPKSALTRGLEQALLLLIVATAMLLSGGLWMAWKLGGRIARAIHGLTGPALELGSGNAVTVPPLHLKEADEVGKALMAASHLMLAAQQRANFDVLTGLANRTLFHEILNQQMALAIRGGSELSLLYVDLDDFKKINDLRGHAVGDDVLRTAAARIRNGIRASDVAARLGGDEFVVLLVESGAGNASTVAAKLKALLAAPYPLLELETGVSASIGIATFPGAATSGGTLLDLADAAMYEAKKSGKNRCVTAEQASRE
jgi:diguanylate cyclase (GGDEF)-like protein